MKATLLALTLVAGIAPAFAQSTLIAWNFDNSTAGASGAAGTFNATGTSEIYNADTTTLTKAGAGLLASSAIVDFSDLVGTIGGTANNNWGTFGGLIPPSTTAGGAIGVIGSGNNGHFIDFKFSTQGYKNIHISYDTRGTATGFNTQTWIDSIDGTSFSSLATLTNRNVTSYSNQGFDAIGVDDQSLVTLRVLLSGATSTSGNNRLDNFTVTGVAIPEPSTYALLAGLAGFAVVLWRRRS
jgi:hypothetical protein